MVWLLSYYETIKYIIIKICLVSIITYIDIQESFMGENNNVEIYSTIFPGMTYTSYRQDIFSPQGWYSSWISSQAIMTYPCQVLFSRNCVSPLHHK